jgi:divalent metal cation (Fe/Co/Zn/Cd) transporter
MSELVKIEPLRKRRETNPQMNAANRAELVKRGILLEYFTIGWNLLEGLIAVGAGVIAGSPSLVGFGFDSFIESTSGAALLWRLRVDDEETRERREQIALRLVGASFLLLAAYVAYDSITTLVWRELPETSYVGIALLIISLIVMPVLARAKRRVAVEIKSRALEADSKQTDLCVYLSAISLGGLALNAAFGWWWADPVAALVMIPIIVNEGIQGLRGEACCDDDACH